MAHSSLVYYYPNMASFVRKDMAILRKEYTLHAQEMPHFKKHLLPWLFLRQALHLLWYLPKAKLCVVQFGGHHAFLPALFSVFFNKPLLIVTGGTDCFKIPEIGYGNFNKKFLGWVTGYAYKQATALTPVHQSLSESWFTYLPGPPQPQGVYNLVKELHTPSYTIYNGYDVEHFTSTPEGQNRAAGTCITVAGDLDNPVKYKRKGVDIILEAAEQLPHFQFTIVGTDRPADAPANTHWHKWLQPSDLPKLLSEHRFYLQLSVAEGFPNALCEGMLCECVPIGSTVAAIPLIIGDTGHLLPTRSAGLLVELLQKADATYTPELGAKARARIISYFTLHEREVRLLRLCKALAQKKLPNPAVWERELPVQNV
jgi:glycosyltransferase involved in cell wall biosynthesis